MRTGRITQLLVLNLPGKSKKVCMLNESKKYACLMSQKKYACLMSHKKVTIALILKIQLGFDSTNMKLDHDMKNNPFWSLSIRLVMLKQSASF